MTFEDFTGHVRNEAAPDSALSPELQALWYAEKGDWDRAHEIAQDIADTNGSWIHANLHREEGDIGNAGYWYRRAGRPMPSMSVVEERHALIRHFLGE